MGYCRNVIEELVIEETKAQIAKLAAGMRKQVNLSEAIAYSLNRLPPMYATTQNGWTQQLKRARSELSTQVRNVVSRALVSVQPDPLRITDPLPETELEGQARSLARLQQILVQPDLKWKDLPKAVAAAMSNVRITPSMGTSSTVKTYLQRSKTRASQRIQIEQQDLDAKDFAAYMAGAAFGYSNILEKLVAAIAVRQMARLSSELAERVPMEEVVAYTLNRLPPMYATSNRGFNALHARSKVELSSQIISTMREGLMKVGQTPYQSTPPLPFDKFSHEQDLALLELQQLLKRDDITWHNVADVVAQALQR